jgi:aryl-alcohol dehydrogenase-like predicted oxidoreductase
MDYTQLGRTGMRVSVAGLGCGGFSKLGMASGASEAKAADVVRAAMDLGVNFIDTAEAYGTEGAVGLAISTARRDEVVVSTKTQIAKDGNLRPVQDLVDSLDASLKRLNTDYVDVFHLHGVLPAHVGHAIEVLAPELDKQRALGKFRHLGITETSPRDHTHQTLCAAAHSGLFGVVMVAFHLMHQNARHSVFPLTQEKGVGTLLMFVVRQVFSQAGLLEETVSALVDSGELAAEFSDGAALEFLAPRGDRGALINAAYRYARHEPGADVVLFGTSDIGHLKSNIESILAPALDADVIGEINQKLGHLVGVGLVAPKGTYKA